MSNQIEEMAKDICHAPTCEVKKNGGTCYKYCKAYIYAFRAINADYRKQSEGEWVEVETIDDGWTRYRCNGCGWDTGCYYKEKYDLHRYCPNCGARMKGDEGK